MNECQKSVCNAGLLIDATVSEQKSAVGRAAAAVLRCGSIQVFGVLSLSGNQ